MFDGNGWKIFLIRSLIIHVILHACIFNFNISYRRLSLFGHTNQLTVTRNVFSFFWNLLMYKEIHTRIFYAEM